MDLPTDLRTLAFILALVVTATFMTLFMWPRKSVIKWGILWTTVTIFAFLISNFMLFVAASALLFAWITLRARQQPLQYYFLFLPMVPAGLAATIRGPSASVNALFQLSYPLVVTFFVLIPIAIKLFRNQGSARIFSLPADKYVIAFFILASGLIFARESSITHNMRLSFLMFVGTVFPYMVISRSCRKQADLLVFLSVLLFTGIILASFGVFEELKGWRLYSHLDEYLGIPSTGDRGAYLIRSDLLRVTATFDVPTRFGFFLVIIVGVTLALRQLDHRVRRFSFPLFGIVVMALFFTQSRGPWIGSAVVAWTYFSLSGSTQRLVASSAAAFVLGSIAAAAIFILSGDSSVSSWGISESTVTIEYRWRLLEGGLTAISRSPWLGSADFLYTPEMQELRQGQGIIDLVNYYLTIALEFGVVGLLLFVSIFLSIFRGILKFVLRAPKAEPMRVIGVGLFSILAGIAVMLAGSSASGLNSVYTWAMLSLGAGYIGVLQNERLKGRADTSGEHREIAAVVRPVR